MRPLSLCVSICVCLALIALSARGFAQEPGLDHTMYRMPVPGGFVVSQDLTQLVISQPESAELVFFDTVTEQETARAEFDFQPSAMALRGDSIYVAAKGASMVYEVSLKTGEVGKEYTVPADGISRIAAHPKNPLLFVSTLNFEVYSIDTGSGKATKTDATGDHLAVSPDGQSLYTGMQPRSAGGVLHVNETPDGKIRFIYDRWGVRAMLAKYKIKGNKLELASSQANAAVNGYMMHLSPDGQRLLMTGGGGWRPPAERGAGGGYLTAIYNADNLASKRGQAPHAEAIVYHPVLSLAAAAGAGHNLVLFDAKSNKERETIAYSPGGGGGREVLAFVGKGTKVALYNGANPQVKTEGLHFFDLDLTKDERTKLTKAYGELPASNAKPERESAASAETEEKEPPKKAAKGGKKPSTPASKKSQQEASAGFNDAEGLNSNTKKSSPYALGAQNLQPGAGEPGWESFWMVNERLNFQNDVVHEGDGALHMRSPSNTSRKLSQPYRGLVHCETYVQVPENGSLALYCNQGPSNTSAQWYVIKGKFFVLDGNGQQETPQNAIDTGIECVPEQWHKVAVEIDFGNRTWTFAVDDQPFDHAPLHFRGTPDFLQEIALLCEQPGGAYLDALVVTAKPEPPGKKGAGSKKDSAKKGKK